MSRLAIKIPDVGEGVTEVELVEWHVKPGAMVREDDILAAVMSDKATVEIPSAYEGEVVWVCGEIGKTYAVGEVLVYIEAADGTKAIDDIATETAEAEATHNGTRRDEPEIAEPSQPRKDRTEPKAQPVKRQNSSPAQKVLASPAVRRRARERDIDLSQISGSGPAGRIVDADLESPIRPLNRRNNSVTEINIVGLRRKIAERMSHANAHIPHITIVEEVDVEAIEALRTKMNERDDQTRLTLLPFLMKALSKVLDEMPTFNAHFDDDAQVLRQFGAKHIGIATATPNGLMVPVVKHAEALSLRQCGEEIRRLSDAARGQKATREELSGSTVTITSLGPLGALATTPIINHPEVMILGVNKMVMRPHWNGSAFVPRKQMNLSASFDHRIIDGWDAALFMNRIKTLIEAPALIFMEE